MPGAALSRTRCSCDRFYIEAENVQFLNDEGKRKRIDRYLTAYNAFDLDGMRAVIHSTPRSN